MSDIGETMSNTFRRSTAARLFGSCIVVTLLAQCGTNPEAAKFFADNNVERMSVPHTGTIDWKALDCSASDYATEKGFTHFARADVTMQVAGGYAQPPAVLSNGDGDKRVFATYGFYRSEADWSAAKDDRIGPVESAADRAAFCG
jgi:hypothetical protein